MMIYSKLNMNENWVGFSKRILKKWEIIGKIDSNRRRKITMTWTLLSKKVKMMMNLIN